MHIHALEFEEGEGNRGVGGLHISCLDCMVICEVTECRLHLHCKAKRSLLYLEVKYLAIRDGNTLVLSPN